MRKAAGCGTNTGAGARLLDEQINEGLHSTKPVAHLPAGPRWRRFIGEFLANAGRATPHAAIADGVGRAGICAPYLAAFAFPAAPGPFPDLATFGIWLVVPGRRLVGHGKLWRVVGHLEGQGVACSTVFRPIVQARMQIGR